MFVNPEKNFHITRYVHRNLSQLTENLEMHKYIYIVLFLMIAVIDISESVSERYIALDDLPSLSDENDGNTSTENAIFYDVTTLSECAMKALVVSGLTFLYSKEDKTCVLTETGSSGTFSSGYSLYLRDDKGNHNVHTNLVEILI